MRNLAFVGTLFSLLPSFLGVAVETDLFGPSFQRYSKEFPVVWSDGEVHVLGGKVVISVGGKSTLMVFSHGELARTHKGMCSVKETVELSEPDTHVVIITKTDKVYSGDVHISVDDVVTLKIIKREPVSGSDDAENVIRTDDVFKSTECNQVSDFEAQGRSGEVVNTYSSFGDVVTLKPIELESVVGVEDAEKFIITEDAFNRSEFSQIFDLDFESIFEKDSAHVEDNSKTLYNSVEDFDKFIPQPFNDIETNKVDNETEEISEQDALSNRIVEVQPQLGNNPQGQQFKVGKYEEPMIYIRNGWVMKPYFVNSLTGKFVQPANWKPFTGKYIIPDDTKMLIVNEGNSLKYYKNITKGSKVWYLKRNEEVFYPCIVQYFSQCCKMPTLNCISHESMTVPEVSWDDMFPIESTDLIKDMGKFKIQRKDIKWSDLRQKQSR